MSLVRPTLGLVIEEARFGLFIWDKDSVLIDHVWHVCDNFEIYNLVIYNPTRVIGLIRDFLARYALKDCQAIIALDAPVLMSVLLISLNLFRPVVILPVFIKLRKIAGIRLPCPMLCALNIIFLHSWFLFN